MKRSRLSYDEWKCIKSKKLKGKRICSDFFNGYIGLLEIEEVSEKQIWKFNGEDIVVCDVGRKWLSILPGNDFYCITAMMDELEDALALKDISQEQFELAIATAEKLKSGLLGDVGDFIKYTLKCKEII